jgi:heme-degrading monooxygenase HmoA
MAEIYLDKALETFRELVAGFDGFISYEVYSACRTNTIYMDLVRWSSLEHAEDAARMVKKIQQEPEYSEYLNAFESLEIFNHFSLEKSWGKVD